MKKTLLTGVAAAFLLSGCAYMAPAYERPVAPVPDSLPAGESLSATTAEGEIVLADWRVLINDPRLAATIETALENNRDLRVAVLNVQRARAQYGIVSAQRVPSVGGNVTITERGLFNEDDAPDSLKALVNDQASANLAVTAYELDLFGRVASLNEQALQLYFAQEENRRSAELALIGSVTNAWLSLAANSQLLQLAIDTADAQRESSDLTEQLFDAGLVTELDYQRAVASVETSEADIARFRAATDQARNALRLLVGTGLGEDLLPPAGFDERPVETQIALNASSDILLLRPDVAAAERQLIAANANIGAARAAFFPRVTLTGSAGYSSTDFDNLFDADGGVWSFGPSIDIPIFTGGANRANLRLAETDREIALNRYEQSIQAAFRETADALAVAETIDTQIAALERLVAANARALDLSELRLREGVDSYLSVLDAQRSVYQAEQALINARLTRYSNAIALYQAVGGVVAVDADVTAGAG